MFEPNTLVRPPSPAAGSAGNKMQSVSTSGASSTDATSLGLTSTKKMRFIPLISGGTTGDLVGYAVWGDANVGAATTSDYKLYHNTPVDFVCLYPLDTYIRIIRVAGTDITVQFWAVDSRT